jgi:hypothetical protein
VHDDVPVTADRRGRPVPGAGRRDSAHGITLADLVDDQRPDEAAVLRWVETYYTAEELDALAEGIVTEP